MAKKRISGLIILVLSLILLFAASPSNVGAKECVCDVKCYILKDHDFTGQQKYKSYSIYYYRDVTLTVDIPREACILAYSYDLNKICSKFAEPSPSQNFPLTWVSTFSCVEPKYCTASAELGPDAPEILTLRSFRDDVLVKTETGQRLKDLYYRYSPAIIQLLDSNDYLKAHALGSIRKVSALIDEYLYGNPLGEDDYDYVRSVIEKSINMLRSLQSRYPQAEPDEVLLDDGIAEFLTDETLSEISGLIKQLLDELGHGTQFSPAKQ